MLSSSVSFLGEPKPGTQGAVREREVGKMCSQLVSVELWCIWRGAKQGRKSEVRCFYWAVMCVR